MSLLWLQRRQVGGEQQPRVHAASYRIGLVDQDLRHARRGPTALGAGVVYTGNRKSTGGVDPYGLNPAIPAGELYTVVTPSYTTVDALAEVTWSNWRFALNVTNLLNNKFFASCLARGDCFMGAPRNVMATVGYRF